MEHKGSREGGGGEKRRIWLVVVGLASRHCPRGTMPPSTLPASGRTCARKTESMDAISASTDGRGIKFAIGANGHEPVARPARESNRQTAEADKNLAGMLRRLGLAGGVTTFQTRRQAISC
eukprot:365617-Chlamydomonas_euryale.AAC.23